MKDFNYKNAQICIFIEGIKIYINILDILYKI